jgi:F0F1-type ATP synthase assembly protein I
MTKMTQKEPQMTTQPMTSTQAAILLLLTFADTTWRALVPTIGGTIIGVSLDSMFKTAPTMTIISIILGSVVSALLIIQQLRKVRRMR